ncbi:3-demethylubiquinone-9 3-methyltransferase [compost metagenome]
MYMNAYLTFDGKCEEAFRLYARVLGGELPLMMRFSDAPEDMGIPEAERQRIMHVRLQVGDQVLMGSDTCQGMPYEGIRGVSVSVNVDSKADAKRIFDGLAEGGKVTMALEKTFWAALFGVLEDRFGVAWMINCEHDR